MSYANGTTYFNLPQTVGTDKRDWADTNQAFADVDSALHTAAETASDAATNIAALQTTVAGIQTDVSGLTTTVNSHTSSIATINETLQLINTALTQLNTNVATKFNSVSIADAYDPTSTYSVGDVVTYAGDRYKCVTAVTTGEPFDADKWVGEDVQTVLSQINSDLANKVSKSHAADYTAHKDGTKTWAQLLYLVFANIDFSKVNAFSLIVAGSNYFRVSRIQENHVVFVYTNIGSTTPQMIKYNIQDSNNVAVYWDGSTLTDISSNVADEDISIFY